MRDDMLLAQISETSRTRLLTAGTELVVEPGRFLLRDGEPSANVFVIVDGMVKIVKTSMGGKISFLGLRRAGSLVGELGVLTGAPRASSLEAVHHSRVRKIASAEFDDLLAECPDLARAVLAVLASRLREATSQIHDLISADAATRMASRLVQLADDTIGYLGDGSALELPVSQIELGEWVGLSRAGAVNALRDLRHAGLISTSRMSVVIIDLHRLRSMALA